MTVHSKEVVMTNDISPEDFQRLLVKRLRDKGWTIEERGELELRIGGQDMTFYLDNMYQQYREGTLLGDIVKMVTKTMSEAKAALESTERPLDLTQVMPMLKSRGWLDEVQRTQTDELAWQPFITDDIIVTLVVDMPNSLRYVKASEVTALQRTFDDVLELALANLLEHSAGGAYQLGDDEAGRMFILATHDGYDATRILLSPLLAQLAEQVNGQLIIGIPNRDFLIAFGNADPLTVGKIGLQVKADSQSRTYPLTPTLFTYHEGELTVYEEGNE
jgi:uncharacterized protein YtpQ (UPF0354 family)